ncbi:hypothetical protein HY483_00435 [Candidatus Woesearchaeota archaeon]|nr:hypothetical protein [Candidatus Woesearchaeota archaeon]
MEIPKYVQLDFFSVILGIFFFSGATYIFAQGVPTPEVLYLTLLIGVFAGAPLFLFGFYEMQKNYQDEQKVKGKELEIKILELQIQKHELKKVIEKKGVI